MGKVWQQQAQCGNAKEMRLLKSYFVPAGMKRSSLVCTDVIKQALGGRLLSRVTCCVVCECLWGLSEGNLRHGSGCRSVVLQQDFRVS